MKKKEYAKALCRAPLLESQLKAVEEESKKEWRWPSWLGLDIINHENDLIKEWFGI